MEKCPECHKYNVVFDPYYKKDICLNANCGWKGEKDISEMNKSGKEIFNSEYYEGKKDNKVVLHFKNSMDYNKFLNWWVLGEFDKIESIEKQIEELKL